MSMSRRKLISGEWLARARSVSPQQDLSQEYASVTDQYFDSFESCYPLLASAGPLLIDEARARGLDTEGRSQESIARELFARGFTHPKNI